MKNSILFCGDTHGEHRHILDAVRRFDPMAVVLLGDLEPAQPLHIELASIAEEKLWFIHGNHDTDSEADHDHLFGSAMADRNTCTAG